MTVMNEKFFVPPRTIFRNEWKYFISWKEYDTIRRRMERVFQRDRHAENGGYMIRSLYFDDYWNSAYEEKIMGVHARKKYRIRIYDCSDRVISLERKKKQGSHIYKESARLTRPEYDRIRNGDYAFLMNHPQQLCREFWYECAVNLMRPKVIVDYEREPFVMEEGTVRITFDAHVRAASPGLDIFTREIPSYEAVDPDKLVMEVKFTEFCPRLVQELLPSGEHEFSAISKYTLCYEKLGHLTDPLSGISRSVRRSI